MMQLLDPFIAEQYHGGQQCDTAQHADHDSLNHDNTDIHAQRKAHKAERRKTGNGGNRASRHGFKGVGNGMGHRPVLVIFKPKLVILIAV